MNVAVYAVDRIRLLEAISTKDPQSLGEALHDFQDLAKAGKTRKDDQPLLNLAKSQLEVIQKTSDKGFLLYLPGISRIF